MSSLSASPMTAERLFSANRVFPMPAFPIHGGEFPVLGQFGQGIGNAEVASCGLTCEPGFMMLQSCRRA
jgi:hypothetical protein